MRDERVVRELSKVFSGEARRSREVSFGRHCEDRHRMLVTSAERPGHCSGSGDLHCGRRLPAGVRELPCKQGSAERSDRILGLVTGGHVPQGDSDH
jgi:hypothetical protein